jgi:hypothetical protein
MRPANQDCLLAPASILEAAESGDFHPAPFPAVVEQDWKEQHPVPRLRDFP